MLYIVCALKPEAQAFIDKYKLKKESLKEFKTFSNADIRLIVSGVGVKRARLATQTLINSYDISDKDIYINIGICGASTEYTIGELLNISSILYEDIEYTLSQTTKHRLTCLDVEATKSTYPLVDMESFGFYDATSHSPAIKHSFIFKVVSDHFEPHKVTKDKTKSLIFNVIDAINSLLLTKDNT